MVSFELSSPVLQGESSPVTVNHAGTIEINCAAQPLTAHRGFAIITLDSQGNANIQEPEHEDHKLQYQ